MAKKVGPANPFSAEGFKSSKTNEPYGADAAFMKSFGGRVGGPRQQWEFEFPNGYGASVITGSGAYGTPDEPYELAVLEGDSLCYDTPITDDVLGYLTVGEVNETLAKIAALPAKVAA